MLLWLIPLIAAIIAFVVNWDFEGGGVEGFLVGSFAAGITAFCTLFVTWLVLWPISIWVYDEDDVLECHQEDRVELVQLNDFVGTEGHVSGGLFVVYGQIDSSGEFSYYQRNKDGSFNFGTIDADYTTVHEKSDVTPSIVETQCYDPFIRLSTEKDVGWLGYLFPYVGPGSWDETYDLTVPEGSIGYGIKLDGG